MCVCVCVCVLCMTYTSSVCEVPSVICSSSGGNNVWFFFSSELCDIPSDLKFNEGSKQEQLFKLFIVFQTNIVRYDISLNSLT